MSQETDTGWKPVTKTSHDEYLRDIIKLTAARDRAEQKADFYSKLIVGLAILAAIGFWGRPKDHQPEQPYFITSNGLVKLNRETGESWRMATSAGASVWEPIEEKAVAEAVAKFFHSANTQTGTGGVK